MRYTALSPTAGAANAAKGCSLMIAAAVALGLPSANAGVTVDFGRETGRIRPLHGVNNSPVRVGKGDIQHEFAAAGIPYMRTHDTAGAYGGAHYVDIPNLFPDFSADENDSASYDFALTDAYLKPVVEAGTAIFFRLGTTIENNWRIRGREGDGALAQAGGEGALHEG